MTSPSHRRPAELPLLLAFDLDGTLVPELGNEVPVKTAQALRRLHGLGVHLAVITGRDLVPEAIAQAAPFSALASQNGGRVVIGGELHTSASFTPEELEAILAHELEGARLILYSDGTLYLDPPPEGQLPGWIATRGYRPLAEARGQVIEKVGLHHAGVAGHAARLRAGQPQLVLTGAQPPYEQYLTVTPSGAHKGAALTRMAEALKVPLSRTAVFGDTDNDIAMFEVAGYAVQLGTLPLLAQHANEQLAGPAELGAWLDHLADSLEAQA
ncbi:HAD family hydrolase [Deinococcus sp. Marseille-Q6407]|uniref:HAD family hydrolase n=1 Tax=Deinococcus sp. Marseille-Q6407 TaxID=2969223 RepID=UPI0021BE6B5F|nr:HAD family hydrolase [Deinococcus sp. Marseille-Q6407]